MKAIIKRLPLPRRGEGRGEGAKGPFASPGFHLWHASLKWTQEVAAALKPLGLTHTQFFLLGAVGWLSKSQGHAPKQREVAEFAQLDKVMTSQVTRSLEGDGLIEREDDEELVCRCPQRHARQRQQ